jgi:ElaB/YqjD/DUF883 family membrane-anchored ribosome-binding protein
MARKNSARGDGARARNRAGDAYQTARDRTLSAYEAARGRAADVTRQATDQIAIYPVGAVIGGLAVGALLGVLLPRSRREDELLGTAGRRLNEAARDAAQKGVEVSRERIDQLTGQVVNKVGSAVVEAVGGKS